MARILVVDDSQLVVRYLQRMLTAWGHQVEALDSFVRLTAAVATSPPDLLILDLHMPALSGVATGKLVRTHQLREVPILIYSSAPEAELEAAARELRAAGYVQKGGHDALRAAVDRILSSNRPEGRP